MYSSDIYYEMDSPDSVKTYSDIAGWCRDLSESHFNQFDKARMRNSKRSHQLVDSEAELIELLSTLMQDFTINDLWIHCISGEDRRGILIEDIQTKKKIMALRLFKKGSREMKFIYFPVSCDISEPIEYLMTIINTNIGTHRWRKNGSEMFYSGMPVYEES